MSTHATPHQPTPELPPPIRPGPSPFWPQQLADLLLRPTRFFTSQLALGSTPNVVLVTWVLGMSSVIARIDSRIMRRAVADLLFETGRRAGGIVRRMDPPEARWPVRVTAYVAATTVGLLVVLTAALPLDVGGPEPSESVVLLVMGAAAVVAVFLGRVTYRRVLHT